MIKTLYWTDEGVVMIDQRRLPTQELYPVFRTYEEVAWAIKEMVIRGAPAIGVAAAMGVALRCA
jgi:methylthioribose-1-phosphate isomerase